MKTRIEVNVYRDGRPSISVSGKSLGERVHVPNDAYLTLALDVDTTRLLGALTDGREVCVSVCMDCGKAYRFQIVDVTGAAVERLSTTHGYCAPCLLAKLDEVDGVYVQRSAPAGPKIVRESKERFGLYDE